MYIYIYVYIYIYIHFTRHHISAGSYLCLLKRSHYCHMKSFYGNLISLGSNS